MEPVGFGVLGDFWLPSLSGGADELSGRWLWVLSHVTLGVSGGWGGRVAKAGNGLLCPGRAAPMTSWASGALPRVSDLAHSLNRKSKGTTIPREARLADFQPSRLPGEAVSPCFGSNFPCGISGDTKWVM